MYTEDNEFDYNDLVVYENNFNSKRPFFNKGLILKILIIIICLVLVMFVVFKLKNSSSNIDNSNNNIANSAIVFNSNIESLKKAAEEYFFTNNNLPQEVGDSLTIDVNTAVDNGFATEIVDHEGNKCSYNISYMTLTKNKNDYMLEINLVCPSVQDSVIYYYDYDYNCLTCNGEIYTPVTSEEDEDLENDNNDNEVLEDENDNTIDENNNSSSVCGVYTEWTDEFMDDDRFNVETRTLVKGYKDNVTYGEWSEPTNEKIEENDNLEVKTEIKNETVASKTDWSSESTTKPSSKSGREISARSVKKAYTTTSCTGGGTYTKTLNKWDNNADSCIRKSIDKVVCTYTSKKTCKDVTNYKTITYYKYRDTVTKKVETKYYSSRVIYRGEPTYTDYILESEMPEGYKLLDGSQKTQYRYSLKCGSGK